MKFKHFLAAGAAIIGIASIAAAVTLFVNKLLGANMKSLGYIECGCANDDEEEQPLEKEEIVEE